jgi:hypothetical protein
MMLIKEPEKRMMSLSEESWSKRIEIFCICFSFFDFTPYFFFEGFGGGEKLKFRCRILSLVPALDVGRRSYRFVVC